MEQTLPIINCPVCNYSDVKRLRDYRYHHPAFKECKLVLCNNCGMVFAAPMPSEAELHTYNAGYFENAHGGINTDALGNAYQSAVNLLRVLYVEAYQEKNRTGISNVLEIGPGGAQFAAHWLQRNKGTDHYTAVESDSNCHGKLEKTGVQVYSELSEIPTGSAFQLVVISHVLEHTSDPVSFIKSCTQWLAPGGILFIEVPCMDYDHKDIEEPHLLFFDKEPMHLLLTETGFSNIKLSYHGNTISELKKEKPVYDNTMRRLRHLLLRMGILFPFAGKEKGLEEFSDPLERAMIKPFKAHIEQSEPAWWLRAIAIKKTGV